MRAAHIALFVLASRDDPRLRHSVVGLAASTAVGAAAVVAGSLLDGDGRVAVWAAALVFDMAGPLVIDPSGWRLVPGHFAERHGLIVIVALGESIVAIGMGAEAGVDGGVILAAVLGMALACGVWWAYFDVSALVAAQRLAQPESVPIRNRLARDAFSYLHLPVVAAIVLVALGMKSTLAHVGIRWTPRQRRPYRRLGALSPGPRRLQAPGPRHRERRTPGCRRRSCCLPTAGASGGCVRRRRRGRRPLGGDHGFRVSAPRRGPAGCPPRGAPPSQWD